MKYQNNSRFDKDLKKLLKKYRTLEEDLVSFKKNAIELMHVHKLDNGSIKRVPGLVTQNPIIYKAVRFACRSLKGKGSRSGIRVVYAYFPDDEAIEMLQIYCKEKDDTDMDYDHIKTYLSMMNNQ